MITYYTTCASCRGLLEARQGATHHDTCPAPPPERYEAALIKFRDMVAWMTTHTATLTPEQATAFDELRLWLQAREDEPPRLKDAALAYVSWGWPVFPLRPFLKTPATPNGFKDATLDPDKIAAYWDRYPDANIGLPTGVMFDVVDIDVPTGLESWNALKDDKGDLIPNDDEAVHAVVDTASGGRHLYVPPTGGGNLAGGKDMLPGIDYRGKGGYVVAPPSWLGTKAKSWRWQTRPSPTIRI